MIKIIDVVLFETKRHEKTNSFIHLIHHELKDRAEL